MRRSVALALVAIVMFFCPALSIAEESFTVTLSILVDGQQRRPRDNVFNIQNGAIPPFIVHLMNRTEDHQKLYEEAIGERLSSITFEVTDEYNNENTITKAIPNRRSTMQSYSHIPPGGVRDFQIVLDEREWNNAFKLYDKGSRKFKVRAIFQNENKKIYSDYYAVNIE